MDCLARPDDEQGRRYALVEHLEVVGRAMGNSQGSYAERLRFLAGLLHDAGKALPAWQDYIRRPERERRRGLPHAYAGAMLFALALSHLLSSWRPGRKERAWLAYLGLHLITLIYHHHGEVADVIADLPPWQSEFSGRQLAGLDLPNLLELVQRYFPELHSLSKLSLEELQAAVGSLAQVWSSWQNLALRYVASQQGANPYAGSAHLCLSVLLENHRLVSADRLHAAGLQATSGTIELLPEEAKLAAERLHAFCAVRREQLEARGADVELLTRRQAARTTALGALHEAGDHTRFFSLELPTGYGKTLTSVALGLEAIAKGLCHRLLYVAPYLSILSQAAGEIAGATGLEVVVHHHLSALELDTQQEDEAASESTLSDAWLAPVVATTYNQLFRALFPSRAQHTLRLGALRGAWIIVDEPQTVATPSWNPFLALLEAASAELGCRVLFATATLPELRGGLLESSALCLAREAPVCDRYVVRHLGILDENGVVQQAATAYRECGAVAVILNTIRDAAEVYSRIKEQLAAYGLPTQNLYFLSGRLTPLHKRQRLSEIRTALDSGARVLVVCTQVLEAGVDLSFRVILRALPVLPALVQAAGRCNRHGEGPRGEVLSFEFRRNGSEDTRLFVYRDPAQRTVTQEICVESLPSFTEQQSVELISTYYRECYRRNTHQATLEKIVQAANGHWRELAGLAPFGAEVPQWGLFIPRAWDMPSLVRRGMDRFGIKDPEELWERYVSRGYLSSLGFAERRRFMALMYQFMVQVPMDVAREVGTQVAGRGILRLSYPSLYQEDLGLSLLRVDEAYEEQFV